MERLADTGIDFRGGLGLDLVVHDASDGLRDASD